MKSVFLLGKTGCFLPLLFLINLIFGWMFFKPLTWLATEGAILLLIFINSFILIRKISSLTKNTKSNVIDVEGEVVEEKKKLK